MNTINIKIVDVTRWGSFLFVNDKLLDSDTSLSDFNRNISNLIKNTKSGTFSYIEMSVKFNKKLITDCPYQTFYDVTENTDFNEFIKWFKPA